MFYTKFDDKWKIMVKELLVKWVCFGGCCQDVGHLGQWIESSLHLCIFRDEDAPSLWAEGGLLTCVTCSVLGTERRWQIRAFTSASVSGDLGLDAHKYSEISVFTASARVSLKRPHV